MIIYHINISLELSSLFWQHFMNNQYPLGYSQIDMRGVVCEAVFIYCEQAATKQIGLPEG